MKNTYDVCLGDCRKCKLSACFTSFSPCKEEVDYFLSIDKKEELLLVIKSVRRGK